MTAAEAVERVVAALTPDLLSPEWAVRIRPGMHPTTGLCSVASEAVWFLVGGSGAGLRAMVARDEDGSTHWWLERRATGEVIDPTRAQYDEAGRLPPYERGLPGRPCGFQGVRRDPGSSFGFGLRPSRRAAAVLDRVVSNRG